MLTSQIDPLISWAESSVSVRNKIGKNEKHISVGELYSYKTGWNWYIVEVYLILIVLLLLLLSLSLIQIWIFWMFIYFYNRIRIQLSRIRSVPSVRLPPKFAFPIYWLSHYTDCFMLPWTTFPTCHFTNHTLTCSQLHILYDPFRLFSYLWVLPVFIALPMISSLSSS